MGRQSCGVAPKRIGWRDYCIVTAPERSGLGTFVVLPALVSRRAFVLAKRERGRTPKSVGIEMAYRGRTSGVLVELSIVGCCGLR